MALTQEQINNLKPGDIIVIRTRFIKIDEEGDIEFDSPFTYHGLKKLSESTICSDYVSLPSEHGTSVPPKYAPTRLFKKGDKVRVVEWNGRKRRPVSSMNASVLTTCEYFFVKENENENDSLVTVMDDRKIGYMTLPPCYLELVTPVEEFEPYSVVDAHTHWEVADKDMKIVSTYSKLHHHNAKEAAEAECARLNAEYRKNLANEATSI